MGHLLKEDIRVEKQKVVLRARIISWHRTSHSQFCKNSFSFVVQFLILGLCDYLSVISLQDRELQEDWCRGCFAHHWIPPGQHCARLYSWLSSSNRGDVLLLLLFFKKEIVFVCSVCCSRILQTRWLLNSRHVFLTVQEAGSARPRGWQILWLVRTHFLVHRWSQASWFSCGWKGEGAFWGFLYKSMNFIQKSSTFMTSSPPRGPISKYHHAGC